VLGELLIAVEKRSSSLRASPDIHKQPMARSPTPPPSLNDRPRREQGVHLTIGADLVLELCRRQLTNGGEEREAVDALMAYTTEVANAWAGKSYTIP
jgi:hypothetical protein